MPTPTNQQGNLREGYKKLKLQQGWPLERKIDHANSLIATVLENHDCPIVCWSGGKDSTVLLHLVLQHNPEVNVIFNDTGVEFPETREFVKGIVDEWGLVNFHVAKPEHGESFWDVAEEYGWPILGKEPSKNVERGRRRLKAKVEAGELSLPDPKVPLNGVNGNGHRSNVTFLDEVDGFEKMSDMERVLVSYDIDISTRCCHFLKEKPTKAVEEKLGVDCKILGLMASESRRRMFLWVDYGEYYYVKRYYTRSRGIWKALPMAIWTEDDVWEYHEQFNIPYCEIYNKGHDRNGCWTCGMGAKFGQFERLRKSHPKLFEYLMIRRSMGRELLRTKVALNMGSLDTDLAEQWAEDVDIGELLSRRPCFFDEL